MPEQAPNSPTSNGPKRLAVSVPTRTWQADALAAQAAREQRQALAVTQRLWAASGVGKRHAERATDTEALRRHEQWAAKYDNLLTVLEAGESVVLLGDRGGGKTQMAVCAMWHWCLHYGGGLYRLAASLHDEWLDAQGENKRGATTAKYAKARLLIVDAIQGRYETDAAARLLNRVFDLRYANKLPTVLVGNCPADTIVQVLGPDIFDRIREGGGQIVCDWESFRGKAQ